jgi:pyruvate,water dikinase
VADSEEPTVPETSAYVIALAGHASHESHAPDLLASRIGAKAAGLARLAAAGIAVPEGLVLTTDAYVEAQGMAAQESGRPLQIPARVDAAIASIAAHFGEATLAVRSSGTQEDRLTASYAGLYETTLGVRGTAQLRAAVLRCWTSASSERVRRYAPDATVSAPIAVLVQRQLAPDVAGVVFSADPVSGDRDVALVSAVPGLGDGVVNGSITPDQWRVAQGTATPERAALQALTAEQALAVAELARRIETIDGVPQDIEWAMDTERLIVLQARPITALPQPPRSDALEGVWLKEQNRYTEPMTVLGASVATAVVARGLSAVFARYGGLIARVECRSIGGEIYQRMVPIGGHESAAPPPWWLLGVLVRTSPELRHRMREAHHNASPAAIADAIARWRNEQRGDLQRQIAQQHAVLLEILDDAALAEHLQGVRRLLESAMAVHFSLAVPGVVPLYVFVRTCSRLLGWGEADALRMLSGVSPMTSEPVRALARITTRLAKYPDAIAAIRSGRDISSVLRAASDELGREFDHWHGVYASSCMSDDPGSATLAERPEVLRELVLADADATTARLDAVLDRRLAVIDEARAQLAPRGRRALRAFEAALTAAEDAYGLREDVAFWTGSQCGGLVRVAALEAGRRLVAHGRIDRAGDVVNLDIDALIAALTDDGGDLRAAVVTAVAERAWVRQHPGPAVLGGAVPTLPDLRGLPRHARTVNDAMQWVRSAPRAPCTPAASSLVGVPGSGGSYEGPARVIRSESEFGTLRDGDVLITTTTDPAWSVLFGIAGALVTESGGVLSHAAIVAREHGIPAVLAVPGATSACRDDELLSVDGTHGPITRSARRT